MIQEFLSLKKCLAKSASNNNNDKNIQVHAVHSPEFSLRHNRQHSPLQFGDKRLTFFRKVVAYIAFS